MSILKYTFAENIQLVNIGDVHRGDDVCDVATFQKVVRYVKSHDSVRWYSTGDLLNNALKNSKSDVYSSMAPQKEYNAIVNDLLPISDKCLGMVDSNHLRRTRNEAGLNLDQMLARELKIPYLGAIGLICVKAGAACYYIAMHHGVGGGRRRGGKINSLEDLAAIVPGADLYSEGHFHAYVTFQNEMSYIDRKRNSQRIYSATFITTGHFLNWEGCYAQGAKMRPTPKGSAIAELIAPVNGNGNIKRIVVDLLN